MNPSHPAVPNTKSTPSLVTLQKFIPFALALLVIFIYWPLGKEFFALDDPQYVVNNPFIKQLTFENIKAIFKMPVNGNYHPLTMLSLAMDYKLYKLNPLGYHFTSLLIHLLSTLLLFFFILKLNSNHWIASAVALLFAIHPMHVESVAWISERKDQLYVLFYFLSLLAYMNYLQQGKQTKHLVYTGLFFLCSLLSKGQAVTLPAALLLLDYFTNRPLNKKAFLEKIPFFILSLIFGFVAYHCQKGAGAVTEKIISDLSFSNRLMLACYSLCEYIFKFFIPIHLSVLHPYPALENGSYPLLVRLSPIFILILAALIWWKGRSNKVLLFSLGFFLINIILLLQLIPIGGALVSERYSYLCYVGLSYLIAVCIFKFWQASSRKLIITSVIIFYLLFLTVAARNRSRLWSDNEKLWANVTEQYPKLSYSYLKLGFIYYRKSNEGTDKIMADSALVNLNKAVKLGWRSLDVFGLRGDVNGWLNKSDSAIADYSRALTIREDAQVLFHRGTLYARNKLDSTGKSYTAAITDFKRLILLNPNEPLAYIYLGDLNVRRQQYDTAEYYYGQGLLKTNDLTLKRSLEDNIRKIRSIPSK